MSNKTWRRPHDRTRQGRDATLAQIIDVIDQTAPPTKAALAERVGISEQYLSELLQELKADDIVRKGYVVDNKRVYQSADVVSRLSKETSSQTTTKPTETNSDQRQTETTTCDPSEDASDEKTQAEFNALSATLTEWSQTTENERSVSVLDLLARLNTITTTQYHAAHDAFLGDDPDQPAGTLESLANERYSAVLSELKSYTLTTDWPGNRIAADLSTIATNLEIVGDRACFIADVVAREQPPATGVIEERVSDIFEAGDAINSHLRTILFECHLSAHNQLVALEETVHRDLDELFELVTAYDPEMYGYLVTITRALERAIHYWVDAAELAVQVHSGLQPEHTKI
ncbi:MAG: hypothetical protein J07HQW1_02485 [Haloquadratum walsbyi J07HQW1]|jgi:DNA-binding Lrp family transcriptional regulator|uniref:Uncharacterized protein n=1 Tax=Haloquadratum walsbyi J07HQW1 TaxID=1238424 RepID=U1PJT7_9EURY|nr:MAG: hypothetical protein J07HQW1_02485 [Haloquadratum walsbyi J07HQW1]